MSVQYSYPHFLNLWSHCISLFYKIFNFYFFSLMCFSFPLWVQCSFFYLVVCKQNICSRACILDALNVIFTVRRSNRCSNLFLQLRKVAERCFSSLKHLTNVKYLNLYTDELYRLVVHYKQVWCLYWELYFVIKSILVTRRIMCMLVVFE